MRGEGGSKNFGVLLSWCCCPLQRNRLGFQREQPSRQKKRVGGKLPAQGNDAGTACRSSPASKPPLSLSRATPFDLEAGCWEGEGGSGCKNLKGSSPWHPRKYCIIFCTKGPAPPSLSLSPLMICRGPPKTAGVGVPQGRTPRKHLINGLFSSKKEIKCENN
jgi:hypothetical protein